ncbi:hypothetical protein BGZ96_007651 [Linnemannia gamsii]|uniref:BIR-domain-containing protein n=1 Tax=Linnemannia gamsii TaxID=64522 RepID=A0ABQ7KK26_9FUNG|nr:hypothetical protein BGZ96_007651 [Linnemannia gamsii]
MTPMLTVDARIDSFTQKTRSWPHPDDFRATPSSLAEAGFYWKPFSASPDNVVCFLCGKSLDDWTKDDDPFEEHLSHSRNCSWAIVKTIYPVEDGLPFHWDDEDSLPKGEKMTKARLQTFGKWWPHERTKGWFGTTKRMANAGFIYAPTDDSDDNVQCPYCETALDGWEIQDNPVHEHQRRRPNCPFFATRASAPTKASAAKVAKQKRKATDTASEDAQSVKDQVQGSETEKSEVKKTTKTSRSQKSTSASEIASNRSSSATNVIYTERTVDFDLPDSNETTFKAGSTRQSADSNKELSRTQSVRVKVEKDEQPASSILSKKSSKSSKSSKSTSSAKSASIAESTSSTMDAESVKSTGTVKNTRSTKSKTSTSSSSSTTTIPRPSTKSTRSERKRNQPADNDAVDSSLVDETRFSYLKTPRKQQDIAIILKKRRKLEGQEEGAHQEMWGQMSGVESEENDDPAGSGGDFDTMQEQATAESLETDASGVTEKSLSTTSVSTQATKTKRGRAKKIEPKDEGEGYVGPSTKAKKKAPSTKATKRTARSTSTSSAKKRATKPLIEIFEQPDVDDTVELEAASVDMHKTETDKNGAGSNQQDILAEAPTLPIPTETVTLPEAGDTQGALQDIPQDVPEVDSEDVPPSTPPPITSSLPMTPIRGQTSDSPFRESHSTTDMTSTPARRQAVTFEDIEDADVVVVDPSTPIRRAASRMDIEGWEDEDRRDSTASEFTSPFLSPSQWHLDAGLMTSTPIGKRTPAHAIRGITPRQKRIKDVIGTAHLMSPLRSSHSDRLGRSTQLALPSPKKAARSQQAPPDLKQSMLIDRLETLMYENASSEVMVVAEHALKEEVKQLRRSQNKERRQAVAVAAEAQAEVDAAAAAAATAASILKHKEITGRLEADAFFEDQELDESENEEGTDINLMRTPVKKTARVLFESTTPTTPNRTPSALPVSRVITAIGAASRRNNTAAAMSPFVRTPVKKSTTDLLRLEDLDVDPDFTVANSTQAPPQPQLPQPQSHLAATTITTALKPGVSDVQPIPSSTFMAVQAADVSMSKAATGTDPDTTTASSSYKDPSHHYHHHHRHQQQQQQLSRGGGDSKGKRLHPDPEEHRRRTRLLEEANFSESQLKMTVEEFHRACTAEQVLALEVAAEAWIQRFEEESHRVRRALLDDGMSG